MKIISVCSVIACLALPASAALAQDWVPEWVHGASVSVYGGQTVFPGINYDGGKVGVDQGLNAGGRISYGVDPWLTWLPWDLPGFEIQADIFYNQSNIQSQTRGRFDSLSYMGNLVYHLDTGTPFGVYGGGGAGAVRTQIGDPYSPRAATNFGWQALGGLDFAVTPDAKLFVEYRHQNAHNANLGFPAGPVGNTSDNASIGFKFGL